MFYKKIIRLEKIDSTQNYAKRLAESSPSGTVVVADRQTKGRGRFERCFHSPPGGLYFSLILKPKTVPRKLPYITRKMAVAAAETVGQAVKNGKYSVFIKPPNDIMVGLAAKNNRPQYKKIAGILTESSIRGNKIDYVVVGVGVNINNRIPKRLKSTAVSLREITGMTYDTSAIFSGIMKNFKKAYLAADVGKISAGYKRLCGNV